MNPFNFKNFRSYGLPLLISFLGFFIGYTQRTNARLDSIHQEQTRIALKMDNYVDVLHRIEAKVDGLSVQVETNTLDVVRCNSNIEKMSLRINVLESKHAN